MLNKQKTSTFSIKKIKWEISPKQNKRSLQKKKVNKKLEATEKKLALKYRYEDLFQLDIPDLMLNIWCYSGEHGVGCSICTTYKKYCINALKKSGTPKNLKTLMISLRN